LAARLAIFDVMETIPVYFASTKMTPFSKLKKKVIMIP